MRNITNLGVGRSTAWNDPHQAAAAAEALGVNIEQLNMLNSLLGT